MQPAHNREEDSLTEQEHMTAMRDRVEELFREFYSQGTGTGAVHYYAPEGGKDGNED